MTTRLVISCEHGGNEVPSRFGALFQGHARLLASHRGWDPGALELAIALAAQTRAPLIASKVTRLLVDLNRSEDNPGLWSTISSTLTAVEQRRVLARFYRPYRRKAERHVRQASTRGRVVHLSVHTFTPVLRGERRRVDIGVLFDPSRPFESAVAQRLMHACSDAFPKLRVRANEPYRGTDDGFTTLLRTRIPDAQYAGIEIEVNQRLVRRATWARVQLRLAAAIGEALAP